MEWQPIESPPTHGQKVRTLGGDGREFNCEYFEWSGSKPRFKVIGTVWDHHPVTHWMPLPQPPKGE